MKYDQKCKNCGRKNFDSIADVRIPGRVNDGENRFELSFEIINIKFICKCGKKWFLREEEKAVKLVSPKRKLKSSDPRLDNLKDANRYL